MSDSCVSLNALLLEEETASESESVQLVRSMVLPKRASRSVFNSSRSRRRHEILFLREQVIALQEVLAAHEASSVCPPETSEREHKTQLAKQWQAMARTQREQRRVSESEREYLRRMLKKQRHLIRGVARIFSKQRELRLALATENILLRPQILHMKKSGDYQEIFAHLPTMILQLNGLFTDPRLASEMVHFRDVRVMNEATSNMTVETLDSRIVPFDMHSTAGAVWELTLTKIEQVTHWMEEETKASDNSLQRTFAAAFNFPSFQGQGEGRLAAWRIVEAERVVILQCAFLESGNVQDITGDVFIRHFSWTVIGPPRNEKLRSRRNDTCQVDSFEVSIPRAESLDLKTLELMRNQCLEAVGCVADIERKGVDNLLLTARINM